MQRDDRINYIVMQLFERTRVMYNALSESKRYLIENVYIYDVGQRKTGFMIVNLHFYQLPFLNIMQIWKPFDPNHAA